MLLAEAEVTARNERTHAAGFGERQRLAVVAFSVLVTDCGSDVTVEAEGMGLCSPSPQPPSKRQGLSGEAGCFFDPPGREIGRPRAQKYQKPASGEAGGGGILPRRPRRASAPR